MAVRYDDREVIYARGDRADAAYRIESGKVRLSREGATRGRRATVVGPGEIFGDAELLSGARRAETAEAEGAVTLTAAGLEDVLAALAADPEAAGAALAHAFDRLAAVAPAAPEPPAAPRGIVQFASLRLLAATPEMTALIGADGARIGNLPFRVGRHADGAPLDLALADERPYIVSRQHFAIERAPDGLAVRDLGSHHGTIVNGTPIRGTEQEDAIVLLVAGANQIVAGMPESPFRFVLFVEPAG
jgi:hypothetical protein